MSDETANLTVADFLLARIAEDERRADDRHDWECHRHDPEGWCDCGYPARVLAECEAKRRIVADLSDTWTRADYWTDDVRRLADHVWKCLALPYADHPDYRGEWRP